VLDGDELAVLAESFLNEAVVWEAPAAWTEGAWIEIVLSESGDDDDDCGPGEDDPPPGALRASKYRSINTRGSPLKSPQW
jgi:hypothetical protein